MNEERLTKLREMQYWTGQGALDEGVDWARPPVAKLYVKWVVTAILAFVSVALGWGTLAIVLAILGMFAVSIEGIYMHAVIATQTRAHINNVERACRSLLTVALDQAEEAMRDRE